MKKTLLGLMLINHLLYLDAKSTSASQTGSLWQRFIHIFGVKKQLETPLYNAASKKLKDLQASTKEHGVKLDIYGQAQYYDQQGNKFLMVAKELSNYEVDKENALKEAEKYFNLAATNYLKTFRGSDDKLFKKLLLINADLAVENAAAYGAWKIASAGNRSDGFIVTSERAEICCEKRACWYDFEKLN